MYKFENFHYVFCIPWNNNEIIEKPGEYFLRLSDNLLGQQKKHFVTYISTLFLQSILTVVNNFLEICVFCLKGFEVQVIKSTFRGFE